MRWAEKTNAKIRGNAPAQSTIGLHRLVFPGRQPKLNSWQVLADLDDFPQVIEALQVAGIVPAKVAISRAVDERRYRIHPAGIGKAPYPLFHGSLNLPKDIPAACAPLSARVFIVYSAHGSGNLPSPGGRSDCSLLLLLTRGTDEDSCGRLVH